MKKSGWIMSALLLGACHREPPAPTEPVASSASAPIASSEPPTPAPSTSAAPLARGPVREADTEQRKSATLDLILGGDAQDLPERATDNDAPFDPGLRDRVAPKTSGPTLRHQHVAVAQNALPVEVVTRIVRQNYGRIRMCYQNASAKQPGASGSLRVEFTIGADGAVSDVKDAGSTLDPASGIVPCATRAFGNLRFPAPTGGPARVVYEMSLAP